MGWRADKIASLTRDNLAYQQENGRLQQSVNTLQGRTALTYEEKQAIRSWAKQEADYLQKRSAGGYTIEQLAATQKRIEMLDALAQKVYMPSEFTFPYGSTCPNPYEQSWLNNIKQDMWNQLAGKP